MTLCYIQSMRIKVSFSEFNGNDIVLPIHYLYSLHCLIYKMFTPEITHKLYLDGGFPYKDRKFKLFSYSRILEHGNVNKEQHTIQFGNNISFYFACSLPYIVNNFINSAFTKDVININGNALILSRCEIIQNPVIDSNQVKITMISPMTAYSTFNRNGKNVTHYYAPTDQTFNELVEENAKRKYAATQAALGAPISDEDLSNMHLQITPKKYSTKQNKKVLYFKNKVVEAYTGVYVLEGSPELIQTTYDCGIGASTSEGFGMWQPRSVMRT